MTFGEVSDEPRWLTETMLLAIHAQQIERFGGGHGVRDPAVLRSALVRPIHRWAYDSAADFPDLAAAYLVGLARSQGFVDGKKRTALAGALVFLALNGLALHVAGGELYALVMKAATGGIDDSGVAAYLRERVEGRG